jgi:peptide/nickel transport system permease protein
MQEENKDIEKELPPEQTERIEQLETIEEAEQAEQAAQAEQTEQALETGKTEEKGEFLADNIRVMSPGRMVAKRFFRSKLSMVGLITIIALFLFSFIGPLFSNWGETEPDMTGGLATTNQFEISYTVDGDDTQYNAYIVTVVVTPLNKDNPTITSSHWLGTDSMGYDVLTRLMYGGRISLTLGFVVVFLETILGVILGGLAGYFGKWVDMLIMRIVDILNCIPSLPIMLIISAILDAVGIDGSVRIYYMMVMLTLLGWSGIARLVRGQILMLREQEYMVAAEACGIPVGQQIFKHLVPNVMPQLIVSMTLGLGGVILTEATLGYLGLGVQYPAASWGTIIEAGANLDVLRNGYWNQWIPAGVCIVLAVLGFNFIGDGLRDAFDPKMKR